MPEPSRHTLADGNLASAVLQATPEAVLITDDERRILDANPAALGLLGRGIDDLRLLRLDDLAPAETRARVEAAWRRFMADGSQAGTLATALPDGTVLQLGYTARANVLPGVHVACLRDVLEHVVDARYRQSFAKLPDPVVVLDAIRDADGRLIDERIVFANEPWVVAVTGAGAGDPTGSTILGVRPGSEDRLADHERVIATGETDRILTRTADGTRWMDVHIAKYGDGVITVARDVTEAQASLARLAQSEALYRLLAENAADVVARSNADGRIEWITDSITAVTGWDPAEILGRRLLDYIHPDDQAAMRADTAELVGGAPVTSAARFRTRSGDYRWLSLRGKPIFDAAGRVVGRAGGWRDIATERAAIEQLAAKEQELREAQLAGRTGSWSFDPATRAATISDGALVLFGGSAEEGVRPALGRIITPETLQQVRDALNQSIERREPFDVEAPFLRSGGSTGWLAVRGAPVFGADGGMVALRGIVSDVTGPREAQQTRLAAAARLHAVIEALGEGVIVQDLHGTITAANPSASRILGTSPERIIGFNLAPGDWHGFREDGSHIPIAEYPPNMTLATGQACEMTIRLDRSDGTSVWLHVSSAPLRDASGALDGIVSSFSDLTASRAMEAELRRGQRLDALGQMAGGVAHDFNNILAAITVNAELMRDALADRPDLHADALAILSVTERATTITRQLLAFARRQVLDPQTLDPAEAIQQMVPFLAWLLGAAIEVELVVPAGIWCIRVDPGQLDRVILNLAVNARDAMPNGGRLTISLANVAPGDKHPAGHDPLGRPVVRLTVTDTGVGMDAPTLARAFEPFFSTKESGTGLGLATVYGIIEQSGGRVHVASKLNKGTTITVDLPVVDGPADPPVHQPAAAAVRSATVLIVEDEDLIRRGLARSLTTLGYRALTAESGDEALEVIVAEGPAIDLLLTDLQLPGMHGWPLIRQARQLQPLLKVVVMSGNLGEVPPDDALRPVTLIEKPFSIQDLARTLSDTLGRKPGDDGSADETTGRS